MPNPLAISYHRQDSPALCGAACAQMLLTYLGSDVTALDQDQLLHDAQAASQEAGFWFMPPDGLEWVVNARRPIGTPAFRVLSVAAPEILTAAVIWSIARRQLPAIVLVDDSTHWVVVRGYVPQTSMPSSPGDTAYPLDSLRVNDPFHVEAAPPPPPHSSLDGCGNGAPELGTGNTFIDIASWMGSKLSRVPSYRVPPGVSGRWSNRYVALLPVEALDLHLAGETDAPPRPVGWGDLLDADGATGAAMRIADRLRDVLEAQQEVRSIGRPTLVQRLDRPFVHYYLAAVELASDRGMQIVIDARTGQHVESRLVRPSMLAQTSHHPLVAGGERGLPKFLGVNVESAGGKALRPAEYPMHVWMPCRESPTPYFPFRMLTMASERRFVRSDGAIFSELHQIPPSPRPHLTEMNVE